MPNLTKDEYTRIQNRLSAAKEIDRAMFPSSFGTYYLQDVELLLKALSERTVEMLQERHGEHM